MPEEKKSQIELLRYERKFLISDYTNCEIEQMLKLHPACFNEIFYPRQVNNIYFDSFGLQSYYDNIDGLFDRVKTRIRWYGELFGEIEHPVLEYKIKKGYLGKKDSYVLKPFRLDENFDKKQIEQSLQNDSIPKDVKNHLLSLEPVLLNSYQRKYFLSRDKNFRVTLDYNLVFYKIRYKANTFICKSVDHSSSVLELKYDSSLEAAAKETGNLFPFSLTKNSKYLHGLERILM